MSLKAKILGVRLLMDAVQQEPGVGSKRTRYEALAVLKFIRSQADKVIRKLEGEAREDAGKATDKEETKTGAKYSFVRVGDIEARKYDDADPENKFDADASTVRAILTEAGVDAKLIDSCIQTVETVDESRLKALVALGQVTEDKLRPLFTEMPGAKGIFSLATVGETDRWLNMNISMLENEVIDEGEGEDVLAMFKRA